MPGQTTGPAVPGGSESVPDGAVTVVSRLPHQGHPNRPGQIDHLTPRETEVMNLFARGMTGRQVARKLGISERTVNKHVEHVYAKLNVTNRIAALNHLLESSSYRPMLQQRGA
jgi:DNA-binding NarL/FixJ family response regulator